MNAQDTQRKVWRVYCDGREFGIDYPTFIDARIVAMEYASYWTRHKYTTHWAYARYR